MCDGHDDDGDYGTMDSDDSTDDDWLVGRLVGGCYYFAHKTVKQ